MRIYRVEKVTLVVQDGQPKKLAVQVAGTAATPGWTNINLSPLENQLSADGILDLELVGDPPTDPIMQVLSPVASDLVIEKDVDRIVGVMIHARTNAETALVSQQPGRFTTMALGEEEPWPPFTTLAVGEEGPTSNIGEDSPWKPVVGEKPPGSEDFDWFDNIRRRGPFGNRR